ncbi:MAG: preprotein translocase subunit YajC [Candidatus Sumerlaeota bacterium]|nr:preprotein translocase subunit YajC [Candidatus Sumerlaeota bacterium]
MDKLIDTLALAAQSSAESAQGTPQQTNILMFVAMFGAIFLVFYMLILRPQKKEQKRQEQIRESIKKGDKVVSIGGIHGTVVGVDTTNNIVTLQVDRNVKIDFSKAAIATVTPRGDTGETGNAKESK